jgi:P4 family phage/plasmid primase-like protien
MSEPRPQEFIEFLDLLTEHAPDDYEPWLFRCKEGSKAPKLSYGSWKDEDARLGKAEAVRWMEKGGNVGIAGRGGCPGCDGRASPYCPECKGEGCDDALVNVDIDDEDETTPEDLKDTLMARSRSRTGVHAWYFEADGEEIANIPTDDAGEVRANWQYVVAPGSYVETDPETVPPRQRDSAGYYTIDNRAAVTSLRFEELPDVFQEAHQPTGEPELAGGAAAEPVSDNTTTVDDDEDRDSDSALFDVTAQDVAQKERGRTGTGDRWSAIFHDSDTGENMMLSDKGLLQCWRHNVAHNGLQALCVLSDYHGDCADIGSPHKSSNAGQSCLRADDGEHIWHAWKYAKRNGYIPEDDPVPYSALKYLCRARDLCPVTDLPDGGEGSIPGYAYDGALSSIQEYDDLDPGRDRTDEIPDDEPSPAEILDPDGEVDEESTGGTEAGEDDEGGGDGGVDEPSWQRIYEAYCAAENADERLPARHSAANRLREAGDWRTIKDNDMIWRYEPAAGIYRDDGEAKLRERLTTELKEQYRKQEQSEIAAQLRGRTTVPPEALGGPERMICCQNCVVEVNEDGIERHEHSPDHEFIARVKTEYDPDAECPEFQAFLDDVMPTPEREQDRQKIQEFAGYMLMHWGLPHHKALFLVGPTASGKSTWLDTIRSMLGQDSVASLTPQQMTSERFGGAELYGAWANIRNDIPDKLIENTGEFKELIAGDPVKAEEKFQQPFMFEPTAKHAFSANSLPEPSTDDAAFFRRVMLVAFREQVPVDERDKHLDDKLQAEHPGVLNWCLDGLQRLMRQGCFTGEAAPWQTERTWEKWADSVKRFRKEMLETTGDGSIPSAQMFGLYREFCQREGIPEMVSQQQLTHQLTTRFDFQRDRAYVDGDRSRVVAYAELTEAGEGLLEDITE